MQLVSIYCLSDPLTGITPYIGQSKKPAARLQQHINQEAGYLRGFPITQNRANWLAYLRTIGVCPVQTILEEVEPRRAGCAEGLWLAELIAMGQPIVNSWYPASFWDHLEELRIPHIRGLHPYCAVTSCPYYEILLEPEEWPEPYLRGRLKRDHPEIAEALARGEYKSARAAGKAAGFIKENAGGQLRYWWRKASKKERAEFLEWVES